MRTHLLEPALLGAAAILLALAGLRWQRSTPLEAVPPSFVTSRAELRPAADSLLDEAEDLAVTNDPFRLSNTPPDVRFDPREDLALGARAIAVAPLRPSFALKGIVGGPPWQAVIDGVPGQPPGVVVRQGEHFDKLLVRAVTHDSVIIQGPDTVWILRFAARP